MSHDELQAEEVTLISKESPHHEFLVGWSRKAMSMSYVRYFLDSETLMCQVDTMFTLTHLRKHFTIKPTPCPTKSAPELSATL